MFPREEEHVDNIRCARKDVNQVGYVIVWVCMAHNEDHCVKWFPTGKEVVVTLRVGDHVDSFCQRNSNGARLL